MGASCPSLDTGPEGHSIARIAPYVPDARSAQTAATPSQLCKSLWQKHLRLKNSG
jgi:hypothetical protein